MGIKLIVERERPVWLEKGEGLYIRGLRRGFMAVYLGNGKIRKKAFWWGWKDIPLKRYRFRWCRVKRVSGQPFKHLKLK